MNKVRVREHCNQILQVIRQVRVLDQPPRSPEARKCELRDSRNRTPDFAVTTPGIDQCQPPVESLALFSDIAPEFASSAFAESRAVVLVYSTKQLHRLFACAIGGNSKARSKLISPKLIIGCGQQQMVYKPRLIHE
jgi:hypothetical protein